MPGPTIARSAPARPRLVPPTPPDRHASWSLDLHLLWDVNSSRGMIWGAAWTADGEELIDLPSVDIDDREVQVDVIALLRSLWTDSLAIHRAQLAAAEDASA